MSEDKIIEESGPKKAKAKAKVKASPKKLNTLPPSGVGSVYSKNEYTTFLSLTNGEFMRIPPRGCFHNVQKDSLVLPLPRGIRFLDTK